MKAWKFSDAQKAFILNDLRYRFVTSIDSSNGFWCLGFCKGAGWQIRAVTTNIDENLEKQIALATLADLAHLSQHPPCHLYLFRNEGRRAHTWV